MSLEMKYEDHGIYVRFYGESDKNENKIVNINFRKFTGMENLKYMIWDLSGITRVITNNPIAKSISDSYTRVSSSLPRIKLALLASDKDAQQVCELYMEDEHALQTGWDIRLFDNIDSIRSWVAA